jgi:hypothetical protein
VLNNLNLDTTAVLSCNAIRNKLVDAWCPSMRTFEAWSG